MEAKAHQTTYTVLVTEADVREFAATWPCSNFDLEATYLFEFSRKNGDLVDLTAFNEGMARPTEEEDGPAMVALSDDAGKFGAESLGLQDVLDIRYPSPTPRL